MISTFAKHNKLNTKINAGVTYTPAKTFLISPIKAEFDTRQFGNKKSIF